MKKMFLLLLAFSSTGFSQTKTMDRKYVPIVFKGSQMARVNLVIKEWTAFRFRAEQNSWIMVPFQVDEICSAHGKYNHEDGRDGLISAQDELLIMPEDLGDRAAADQWLDDPNSQKEMRIELGFTDPQSPDKKGWLYLYRNISTDQIPPAYHSYAPAPAGTAADTAKTLSYAIGHNKDGWIDFVSFAAAPKRDIVDRLKLRLAGNAVKVPTVGIFECNEDTLNNGNSTYIPGVVRAFHDQRTTFRIPQLLNLSFPANYQLQYFPNSFRIGAEGIEVDKGMLLTIGLKSIRQSLDLSDQALGGKFYSRTNPDGVLIDGNPDAINTALPSTDNIQWLQASGSWGTILMIMELPQIKNPIMKLYYRDNLAGGTADGAKDSGDLISYGDMGLWVYTLAAALSTDRINVDFNCYFINEPGHDAVFAQQVFDWDQHAVSSCEYLEQTYSATLVHQQSGQPEEYSLSAGYPNPFDPTQSVWYALLQTPNTDAPCQATVYNVMGQMVARASQMTTGRGTVLSWDGRQLSGLTAPAGLYFIQVLTGERKFVQRIVVTR